MKKKNNNNNNTLLPFSQPGVTKTFSGEITAAALNLTATQLQTALNGDTSVLQQTIENQLKELWGASNVTITTFQVCGFLLLLCAGVFFFFFFFLTNIYIYIYIYIIG